MGSFEGWKGRISLVDDTKSRRVRVPRAGMFSQARSDDRNDDGDDDADDDGDDDAGDDDADYDGDDDADDDADDDGDDDADDADGDGSDDRFLLVLIAGARRRRIPFELLSRLLFVHWFGVFGGDDQRRSRISAFSLSLLRSCLHQLGLSKKTHQSRSYHIAIP